MKKYLVTHYMSVSTVVEAEDEDNAIFKANEEEFGKLNFPEGIMHDEDTAELVED